MRGYRYVVRRPFKFEYRLTAPMEVRFRVFQLNAADTQTRLAAIDTLVHLGDPTAVEALIDALDEPLPVRRFAAEAIGLLAPDAPPFDANAPLEVRETARAELRAWWSEHGLRVRETWLQERLQAAGLSARTPAERLQALVGALEAESPVLRYHAHRALVEAAGDAVPYDYNWLPALRAEAARAWRDYLARRE
jgi:HEAT repeat protein